MKSKVEGIKLYTLEKLALIIFCIFLMYVKIYHEPWFDEAEAWLIARDASLWEIFTFISRYEGHPPLWYLSLMPFAKIGVPFEFGLKSISWLYSSVAAYLIIFKSPFNRIIRMTLPFTYFLFYQYGVVSRSYSLLMIGFWLTAIAFSERNRKPWRFVGSLALLCGTSVYGILFSLGLVMAWILELFNTEYRPFIFRKIQLIGQDQRFKPLLLLLLFNLALMATMLPPQDKVTLYVESSNYLIRFLYLLFIAPSDAVFSSYIKLYTRDIIIGNIPTAVFLGLYGALIVVFFVVWTYRSHKLKYFLFPMALIICFSTFIYFSPHHIGIYTLTYIFTLWICSEDKARNRSLPWSIQKQEEYQKHYKMIISLAILSVLLIQTWWSVASSISDIKYPYNASREIAQFIKTNGIEAYTIMNRWQTVSETDGKSVENCYNQDIAVLAYFERNIFYNLNGGNPSIAYNTHKKVDNNVAFANWNSHGLPDFVLGDIRCFDKRIKGFEVADYTPIKRFRQVTVWKTEIPYETPYTTFYLYIRNDLLKSFPHFEAVDPMEIFIE